MLLYVANLITLRLVWIFAGKTSINKICKIPHRALQVIYHDYQKSYDELLHINKDVNIHQKHLRKLTLEVFKSITHVNPEFIWSFSTKILFLIM